MPPGTLLSPPGFNVHEHLLCGLQISLVKPLRREDLLVVLAREAYELLAATHLVPVLGHLTVLDTRLHLQHVVLIINLLHLGQVATVRAFLEPHPITCRVQVPLALPLLWPG